MKVQERLTARNEFGDAYYKECFRGHCSSKKDCRECEFELMYCERLAAYEDLEITPEQVREMDKAYTELCVELGKYKQLEERLCNIFYGQLTLDEIVEELEEGSVLRTIDALRTTEFKNALNKADGVLNKLFTRNENAKQQEKEIVVISPKLSLEFESERSTDGVLYALSVYAIVNGKSEDVATWTQCNDMKEEVAYLLNCYLY